MTDELLSSHPELEAFRHWVMTPPKAESTADVRKRGRQFMQVSLYSLGCCLTFTGMIGTFSIQKLLRDLRQPNASERCGRRAPVVLAATHGGLLHELFRHLLDDLGATLCDDVTGDPRSNFPANTAVTELAIADYDSEDGRPPRVRFRVLNCAKHVSDVITPW